MFFFLCVLFNVAKEITVVLSITEFKIKDLVLLRQHFKGVLVNVCSL